MVVLCCGFGAGSVMCVVVVMSCLIVMSGVHVVVGRSLVSLCCGEVVAGVAVSVVVATGAGSRGLIVLRLIKINYKGYLRQL